MACWLYEGMLMFGVVFIADYLFSTLTQTRHAMDNRHSQQAFLFLIFGIYFVWFWSHGQTLAMKTWDIRVTDRQGRPLSQQRALRRRHHCLHQVGLRRRQGHHLRCLLWQQGRQVRRAVHRPL